MAEFEKEKTASFAGCPEQQYKLTPQVLSLCHQGQSVSDISTAVGLSPDITGKIIAEASQKSRILYVFMDREIPATVIDVCGLTRKVQIVNLTDDLLSRAFGIRENPDWKDYEEFLESRCMPRTRYGIREELRDLGVDSYDPFQIVEKTAGRVHGDGQWLQRMDHEWMTQYDAILESAKSQDELRVKLQKLLAQGIRESKNGTDES